jgi:hypothetical protein
LNLGPHKGLWKYARQGFWNGALPPIGCRIIAGEQRGHRVKKTLEIDPFQAETLRLIFRLALEGDGTSGAMVVRSITKHRTTAGIRTRDGGRWDLGQYRINALTYFFLTWFPVNLVTKAGMKVIGRDSGPVRRR